MAAFIMAGTLFPRTARQGNCRNDGIGPVHGLLHKADDVAVIHPDEPQIAGLQQGRVLAPQPVQAADVSLDVARLVPVTDLDLVFVGVEIFLPARHRLVFNELEAVIDAVIP